MRNLTDELFLLLYHVSRVTCILQALDVVAVELDYFLLRHLLLRQCFRLDLRLVGQLAVGDQKIRPHGHERNEVGRWSLPQQISIWRVYARC